MPAKSAGKGRAPKSRSRCPQMSGGTLPTSFQTAGFIMMNANLSGGEKYNPDLAKELNLVTPAKRRFRNVASVPLSSFHDRHPAASQKWIIQRPFARL